jgi:hypothetical protein
MSDNEYLAQAAVHERLRDAWARAAVARCIERARAAGAPRTGQGRRRPWWLSRAYGAVASSLMSRWRNWRPA